MAKKRYVDTKIWEDNWFANLDQIEQLVFIYFLTNPMTNIIGAYELSMGTITRSTGLETLTLQTILERFKRDKKVFYDNGWVVIPNFIKNQNYNSPKIKIGIEIELKKTPDRIKELLGYGMHTISHSNSNSNSNSNIITDPTPEPEVEKAITKRLKVKYSDEFEKFWEVCPMQKGKFLASESYSKIDPELYPIIIEAMKTQAASKIWTEDKFTPWPCTWLNQMRWEDKPSASAMDPMEIEARALVKQFPPDNDTTAMFRFAKKYGDQNLLKYKHLFNL